MTIDKSEKMAGMGRRTEEKDPRNRQFMLPVTGPVDRASRYWPNFGPVLDQRALPHCVGFAGYKWLTMNPVVNERLSFSPAWLYAESQKLDEWPGEDYDGTSATGLMKVFRREGFITEFRWAFAVERMVPHLLNMGPVLIGTHWTLDMFTPDKNGYIHSGGASVGGHEYLAVGINLEAKNPDGTKGKVQILNSWGRGWSKNGRAWISIPDLDHLLRNGGDAVTATEIKKGGTGMVG